MTNTPRSRTSTAATDCPGLFNAEVPGAQFAWNNDTVTQNQQNNSAIAPGF
ncbi:hypothetical protein ABT124_45670 [Streptomyces sp. NPDC001982]|uniref:hypothetical protein n=1 Tax=unclassified Streptomyces TaxID=2593676 RepID=UPI00332F2066